MRASCEVPQWLCCTRALAFFDGPIHGTPASRLRRKLTSSSGMAATMTLPSSSQVRHPARRRNVLSLLMHQHLALM